jgi:hypothetical protein
MDGRGHRPLVRVTSDAERESLLAWSEGFAVVHGLRELGRVAEVVFGSGGRVVGVLVDQGGAEPQSIPALAIEDVHPRSRTVVISSEFPIPPR